MAHREMGEDRASSPAGPAGAGGWLALSIVVSVLALGLLTLRSLGLDLLGTRGLIAVFILGEALGIGAVVFVSRAMLEPDPEAAAESLGTGRRWALSGLAFVVGMGLITLGAQFLPSAATS